MRAWLLLLLLLLSPSVGEARRSPTVGGEVRLALPPDLAALTRAAALGRPVVEPVGPERPAWMERARPRLANTPLVSRWIRALVPEDDGARWRIEGDPEAVASIKRCFEGDTWPAGVLSAGRITAEVSVNAGGGLVRFDRPLGVLPHLLAGCNHADDTVFVAAEDRLDRSGSGVHRLVLGPSDGPADIRVDAPGASETSLVTSGVDGVVLLVQGGTSRSEDPLGIGSGPIGLADFSRRLGPGLLAEVLADGRAEPAEGLLPRPLVPGRPPRPDSGAVAPADGGGVLRLARPEGRLLEGVADRLAALAQARSATRSREARDARLLRWGPPSEDPALSLLALAAQVDELDVPPSDLDALLHRDPARRLEAALDLEHRWIDERRVVPLLTAKRWIAVHPDLRGVRVGVDGAVLLHDAYWRIP